MHARDAQPRGFSLIEVIVATLIATMTISGLAYTFGLGRGFIDRYEIARAALADAQGRMEQLAVKPLESDSLTVGAPHGTYPFLYRGLVVGRARWTVEYVADLGAPNVPNALKEVTVEVWWPTVGPADTVRLSRLFPAS